MTISLLSRKELLLAVAPGEDGEPVLRFARVDGRRIVKTGEGAPHHFVKQVRASVFSTGSFFEQVDLPAASTKLLPLAARRHVDAELVFDGAYRLRALSRAKRERTITADVAAVPEPDLEIASAMLPLGQRPCVQMVPLELAIAALVRKATAEPVIVFWEKGGVLLSLLISNGTVLARTRESVSEENREVTMARAETSLRSIASRFGERREIFLTLYTGDLCGLGQETREKAAQVFEERLAKLYRVGRGMPKDAVLRDPELYGLPFVDEDWSFLEKDYREQVQSWRYARPAAGLAAIVGIGFALVGVSQHMQALAAAHEFDGRRVQLRETLAEIQRFLPSEDAMASVREGLQVHAESLSEVRLDRMLAWLTQLVPQEVAIRSLEVKPVPPQLRGGKPVEVKYEPGEKPFQVKLEIVLAETTFDAAEASSAEVVRRLSQRLQIMDSHLDVPAPEPGVRRNVELVVSAQARAVSF